MSNIDLAGRKVGPDHPPLVIAEVGINHEGDVNKALQLVDAAADAGAEVVKFQCHITEKEMIPTDMTPGEISAEKLWDIIKRCELTAEEERRVQKYCATRGIKFLSTPFSREAADRLLDMDVPGFKIGSGECNNLPLVDYIARMGRPMIVSTGMNDLASVRETVDVIRKHGTPFALLHCTSMYPTPYDKVRLGGITDLMNAFPGVPIGLSDHSYNIYTCLGAVALGACILEKHFTVTRSWPGPDIGISIEPWELKHLVEGSTAVWLAGGGGKTRLAAEQPVIDFAYASVVTIAPVKAGETLSRDNLWVKRPGNGPIPAREFEKCLRRKAKRDLREGIQVSWEDIGA